MARRHVAPEIADLVDVPLPEEEFLQRVSRPPTDSEIEEVAALFEWFTRRYPTVKARLDYVRRTFARWNRPLKPVKRPR
jgi:hypothetical protein